MKQKHILQKQSSLDICNGSCYAGGNHNFICVEQQLSDVYAENFLSSLLSPLGCNFLFFCLTYNIFTLFLFVVLGNCDLLVKILFIHFMYCFKWLYLVEWVFE